jgi:hypothetical protein
VYDPQKDLSRFAISLFYILLYHFAERAVSGFVALHNVARPFVNHDEVVVFKEDL